MTGPLLANNPKLELEIVATDRLVDIVADGFDAGIRLGESLRDGMTAVRIKPRLRLTVVGSPSYFEQDPVPRSAADLTDQTHAHVCIRNIYPSGTPYPWSFSRAGKIIEFEPTGPLSLDDHELMVEAALSGAAPLGARRKTGSISTIRRGSTSRRDCGRSWRHCGFS